MKAAERSPAYLFIYGTLLTGTPLRRLNRAMARRLGRAQPARIRARLYDLGAYPGAVPSADRRDRVYGRLVAITDIALLRQLDAYEDYVPDRPVGSEFVRRAAQAVRLADRRPVRCWVYFYNGEIGTPPRRRSTFRP